MVIIVDGMGGAGQLYDSEVVADGEGDFGSHELGVRGDNTGPKDVIGAVGEEFDKTVVEIVDFADMGFASANEGFLVFAVTAKEIVFAETNDGNLRESVDSANGAFIIDRIFNFVDQIACKGETGLFGAIGGRFVVGAIAYSIDVFGRSFKIFVGGDAAVFVFDFDVFETVVECGFAAGSKNDAIDTNHFFGIVVAEDDAFAEFVFFEGDNFGV